MIDRSEITPRRELEARWEKCRGLLARLAPGTGGLLACSRLNLYHLAGTYSTGILWLPLEGEPVLLCRRGVERALLESAVGRILPFRSFREVELLLAEAGSPLGPRVGVEMNGLSWALGRLLAEALAGRELLAADRVLSLTRSVKSPLELAKLREAGTRHAAGMQRLLPLRLAAGLTEREVGVRLWEIFFALGHAGPMRMDRYGEEVFLGHIAAGENASYPSFYDGPVGLRGTHPAAPFMGHAGRVWRAGEPLTCDTGFSFEGYTTDKTQVYWAGKPADIPDRARAAHDFCVSIQAWLAGQARPGAVPSELAAECFRRASAAGWEEGFMALGGNKVGFLGHGIGLAIDEYPALAKGFDEPLEAGMVLAIEPKIGIRGLGMVGVENTFEVTPGGCVCLTGDEYGIICV